MADTEKVVVEIGPASAYALAVKYGYTGTEAEWVAEMEAKRLEAVTAASNAQSAATAASQSKTASANSATASSNSATASANSATAASGSATLSESYAHGGTGTRDGEDKDNAKYYMEKAKELSAVNIATVNTTGIIKGGENYIDEDGELLLTKRTTERILTNSYDGGLKINRIYGKSEQKQYSGKNLLDFSGLVEMTTNGVTFTPVYDDEGLLQYIKVNGTATEDSIHTISNANGSVFNNSRLVGCPSGGSTSSYCLYTIDTVVWDYNFFDKGNGYNIASESYDETHNVALRIIVKSGTTCNNLVFKPMLVDASLYPDATYDDFEPYVGGIPSPNPDYPQEIKSVVNPVVKVCGKNLFEKPFANSVYKQNGVTITNNGDGTATLDGTATDDCRFYLSSYFRNIYDKYKFVGNPSNSCSLELVYSDINKGWSGFGSDKGSGFTISSNDTFYYASLVLTAKSGASFNNYVIKPMITNDPNDTYYDFEPYTEQTVTLPYTLNAIPVESGGNVTIDGQQYIADYVDFEKKQLVRMCKERVLDGSEAWLQTNTRFYFPLHFIKQGIVSACLCDKFAISKTWDDHNITKNTLICYWDYTWEYGRISVNVNFVNTVTDFKEWLNSNNVKVIYALAIPEVIGLTDEEIQAFRDLATYYPTTNIFTDSEIEPLIDLEYGTSRTGAYALKALNTAKNNEESKQDAVIDKATGKKVVFSIEDGIICAREA